MGSIIIRIEGGKMEKAPALVPKCRRRGGGWLWRFWMWYRPSAGATFCPVDRDGCCLEDPVVGLRLSAQVVASCVVAPEQCTCASSAPRSPFSPSALLQDLCPLLAPHPLQGVPPGLVHQGETPLLPVGSRPPLDLADELYALKEANRLGCPLLSAVLL